MTTPNPTDVDNIVTCATNEGELYPTWVDMAKSPTPDSAWAFMVRHYTRRLMREHRYSGSRSAATINAAAAALRDYYLRHIAEGA